MADVSASIEFSASYVNLNRFNSGHLGISFDCTGDTQKAIVGKDPTCVDGNAAFHLEYLQFNCGTVSARLYDGSGGSLMFGGGNDSSVSYNNMTLDFRDDPYKCLVADNTQGICLSSGDGNVSGFIKGYWGPK